MNRLLKKNYSSWIFLILLTLIFTIESGSANIFNGLPWSNKYETILFLLILPFVLFFYNKIINYNIVKLIILIIFIFKIILFFSPDKGIAHKFFLKHDLDDNYYIKTYTTFWKKNLSDIQEFDWTKKENFPLDWVNFDASINSTSGELAKDQINYKQIELLNKFEFYLVTHKKSILNINSKGSNIISNIKIKSINNDRIDLETKLNQNVPLDPGKYQINGLINFNGQNWSLIPVVTIEGETFSALKKGLIYNSDDLLNSKFYYYFNLLGNVYDLSIIILLILFLIIIFSEGKILRYEKIILPFSFFIIYLFSSIILSYFNIIDTTNRWPLCLTFIISLFFITLDNFYKKFSVLDLFYNNPIQFMILTISPTLIYFIIFQFYNDLESTTFWSRGDDWNHYQNFASVIAIKGQWFDGGWTKLITSENNTLSGDTFFFYRPGVRYFYSFLHIIFGQSGFSIKSVDFLFIFFSFLIVFSFTRKIGYSNYLALSCSLTMIILLLGENFRWLIGRGIAPYMTLFLILLLSNLLLNNNLKNIFVIISTSILGIIICWLREEKLLIVLSLIFLSTYSNQKNYESFFSYLYQTFIHNNKKFLLYWFIILLGFPILFEFRNYYYSGNFALISHRNVVGNELMEHFNLIVIFKSLYKLLMVAEWMQTPRILPLVLVPPFVLSLTSVFIPKIHKLFNIPALFLILLSLIMPIFVADIAGIPKWSIYLLPFSIMINMIIFYKFFEKRILKYSLR